MPYEDGTGGCDGCLSFEENEHEHNVLQHTVAILVRLDSEYVETHYTAFKLQDISIIQILRQIEIGESRSAKSAVYTHLQALNLDFYEFLHFLKAENCQIDKKWQKWYF